MMFDDSDATASGTGTTSTVGLVVVDYYPLSSFVVDGFDYDLAMGFFHQLKKGPWFLGRRAWKEIRRRHSLRFGGRSRKPQEVYYVTKPEPLARK